jgi:hypothetical protein
MMPNCYAPQKLNKLPCCWALRALFLTKGIVMRWKIFAGFLLSLGMTLVTHAQNDILFTLKAPLQTTSPVADGAIGAGEYSNSLFLSFVDRENPGYPWPNLDHMCPTNCDLDSGSPTAMGDDDLSATMYLAHTDQFLFLGFNVTDGFLDYSGVGAADAFKNDAVELYVDADADGADGHGTPLGPYENFQIVADASDGAGGPAMTPADMEFNNRFTDRADGPQPVGKAPPLAGEYYSAGLVHSDTNYVIEFQIPLESLDVQDGEDFTAAKTGDTLRFTAVIDDNDFEGSQGQDTYGELWYVEGDTRSNWGGAEDNWVVGLELSSAPATVPGDFNSDGNLTNVDIDMLSAEVRAGTNTAGFDLTSDNLVNMADQDQWVNVLKKTYYGDANLDGLFDSGDLVSVFTVGEYEDTTAGNSGWADGDWNGDAEFNSGDFVQAFSAGGYEQGPRPAGAAVPEPSTLAILVCGATLLAMRGIRRR